MTTMNPFQAFVLKRFQEQTALNDKGVLEQVEARDKDLMTKINNFCQNKLTEAERMEVTTESILMKIKTDTITRALFRKDPSKQSKHEDLQVEWIQKHQYPDAIQMSKDVGGTCLSKNKFHIITKANPRPVDATKTFDLYVPSKKMYATLKYTSQPGGAQDNQRADAMAILRQAVGYLLENEGAEETFAFYLDGAYYDAKKVAAIKAAIPADLKERIIITSCASVEPV